MKRVLLIDDDLDTQILVKNALKMHYVVDSASSVVEASKIIEEDSTIDLFIVDLGLPDGDGHQICEKIRTHKNSKDHPIVILSAQKGASAHIMGYQKGADNYLEKPFLKEELLAVVNARINRHLNTTKDSCGNIDLDLKLARAFVNKTELDLTPTEFRILTLLVQKQNHVTTRDEIFSTVWGANPSASDRTIDHHILSLRRKLKDATVSIEGVYGQGYLLKKV